MSGFVTLIIFFIVVNVVSNLFKGNSKTNRKPKRGSNYSTAQNSLENPSDNTARNPWGAASNQDEALELTQRALMRSHAKNVGKKFGKRDADRQNKAQSLANLDTGATTVRNISDKNKKRIYHWGERVGPGFFTLTNLLAIMAFGLIILYIISMIPGGIGS